jgi:RNA polymerase sigma factor (sigma-70 family)
MTAEFSPDLLPDQGPEPGGAPDSGPAQLADTDQQLDGDRWAGDSGAQINVVAGFLNAEEDDSSVDKDPVPEAEPMRGEPDTTVTEPETDEPGVGPEPATAEPDSEAGQPPQAGAPDEVLEIEAGSTDSESAAGEPGERSGATAEEHEAGLGEREAAEKVGRTALMEGDEGITGKGAEAEAAGVVEVEGEETVGKSSPDGSESSGGAGDFATSASAVAQSEGDAADDNEFFEALQAGEEDDIASDGSNDYNKALMDVDDALLAETKDIPLLTAEQEAALGFKVQAGLLAQQWVDAGNQDEKLAAVIEEGRRAEERFILSNQRLVRSIARRYTASGQPVADLHSAGNLRLISAVRGFDPGRGNKFSTYASPWIHKGIDEHLADVGRPVSYPAHKLEQLRVLERESRGFYQAQGREPTPEELAELHNNNLQQHAKNEAYIQNSTMDPDRIRELFQAAEATSLSHDYTEGGSEGLSATLPDRTYATPEAAAERQALRASLEAAFERLSPRQRQVMQIRLQEQAGQAGQPAQAAGMDLTLREIGGMLGLTGNRIGQLERGAAEILREMGFDLVASA